MNKIKFWLIEFMEEYSDRSKFLIFISKITFFTLIIFACVFVGSYKFGKPLLYLNTTPSTIRGIYIASFEEKFDYNDYFIVRLAKDYGNLKRGQLILKQIKGKPGDIYISRYDHLDMNGCRYSILKDKRLPHMPYGAYMVGDNEFMMLNDRENSFDGRYIGPTKKENLVRKVYLLVNYDKLYEMQKDFREKLCDIFPFLEDKIKVVETEK